ncbi:MmgE/PrpD family protein [Burkholderia sp. Bp9099]|uniref:MmgE/PrpD family protein n=1 Tax=Burkholderia sp. Bp9099 TaxID=2184568 RepID=UPI000F5F9CE3|nr:MmgE/PrpD family protein [Burkholderia sp. Bp9099]RQZ47794.1 MmgE/PrpD family protein [Burkholderia sp. Bp9099]
MSPHLNPDGTAGDVTRRLAAAIACAEPARNPPAIAAARRGLLDFLAAAFAGARDNGYRKLLAACGRDSTGAAAVIGSAIPASPQHAALLNGYAGHALDYDDVHSSVRGHPGTVLLPALLALAQVRARSALELLDAYVVGVETMARIGLALGSRHYELGFHNTATLGTLGAAAAAARLIGLDAAATENALGIAATQSAGLRLQFGSEIKPLHAGLAARAGLFAVALAEAGLTGAPGALDGPEGFFAVFGGGASQPARVLADWGAPWQIVSPGLYFKPWPCCTATHYAVQAALDLRERHRIAPADIEGIVVTFPPGGDTPLSDRLPATGLEARFSVEYAVAAALTDGPPGVATFADVPVRDDLIALAARVTRRHDAAAPRASTDPATRFSVVEIALRNGDTLRQRTERLVGADDLAAKFADATAHDPALAFVPELIDTMRSTADLARLFHTFTSLQS